MTLERVESGSTSEAARRALLQTKFLEAQLASVEMQIALLEIGTADPISVPAPITLLPEPEWTTLERAAHLVGVHVDTMRERARRYGLGHKPTGVWKIDMVRVRAQLNGEPYDPLPGC